MHRFVVNMIRVALLNMKPKLRNILTAAVSGEKDMQLIHSQLGPDDEFAGAWPDALVCEIEDPLDIKLPTRLLRALPRARVLMVAASGDKAALYELRPTHKLLLNVSMNQTIDAIRYGLERGRPIAVAPSKPR